MGASDDVSTVTNLVGALVSIGDGLVGASDSSSGIDLVGALD